MKEPIEVTARIDAAGKILPQRLVYRGRAYVVESVGRQRQAEDGLHILVMTGGWRVWELIYRGDESRWYVRRRPGVVRA